MKNFTKKVIILLFVFIIGFTFIGCKKDNPSEENKEIVENYSLVLEVGSKKEIDISSSLEIEVDITNREIVSFSNNTFFALKEGSTTVTLKIKGTENLKQIYSIEVIKEKELNVSYEAEMKVGDKKPLSIKYDEKEVDNFEVFIEDNTILSYQNKEFTALKNGSTNVFITYNTGSKTLTKTLNITVKEVAQGNDDLVITISGNIYANQNVSYTIKTKDGIDVTDYEVEVEDEDLVEFYPEDNEFTTLDEGTTTVTFKALIDGALYTKEIELVILPSLYLDIRISDVITNEKDVSFEIYVMPAGEKLEDFTVNSSNTKVFTTNNNVITPIIPGKGLIIVSGVYQGVKVSGSKSITIVEYVADYIVSNIDNFMIVNNELSVDVSIKPSNSEVKDLSISSSDNSVIEVNNNKLVAKKTGSSKITVSASGITKEYDITVIDVSSIEIVVNDNILLHEVKTFDVIAKPSNTKINNSSLNIIYQASNNNLLINDHALFGKELGSSTISVTLSYKKNLNDTTDTILKATKDVTIYEEEKKIEAISLVIPKALIVGNSTEGSYVKYPSYGEGDILYTSDNEEIIKIEGSTLTALKEGKCKIKATVSDSSIYDEVEVTIQAKKDVMEVSDGLYNGGPMLARYKEESIINYYELMGGVTETTYYAMTSTQLGGDVDGYSGITGEIVKDEYYGQAVHVLEVPSREDVVVVPWASLNNHKWSLSTVRGLIEDYEKHNPGYKVIAAVNGDFFDINANKNLPYSTTGENVSNGEFYKVTNGFSHIGGTIGFTNDGSSLSLVASANTSQKYSDYFVLDVYDDNGNIVKTFNVSSYNAEASANESSVYYGTYNEDKKYVPITPVGDNTFVVEGALLSLPSDVNDFYGKGVITSTGNKELGIGDFAITSNNSELISYLKVGMMIRVQRVFVGEFATVKSATGYNGVIFDEEGVFDFYANGNLSNRAPRTVIGMKEDGTLVMMVVDGRQGANDMYGCDGYELTAIMRSYGCIKAYNVDGGGSSTIVVKADGGLKVLNSPSDGHERTDGNCILICTVDPDYKAMVSDITSTSAKVTVSTNNEAFKDYDTYIEINNKLLKTTNGVLELTGLVHNRDYSYRVYYEKDGEMIPTQTINSFTTPKSGFIFLGLYIEEESDKFIIHSYSYDLDKAGNVSEMTVFFNGKNIYLKNGVAEVDKSVYGDIIEKFGYEYWYNDELGRNVVTIDDGLYFME